MTGAEQRKRPREVVAGRCRRPDAEEARESTGSDARRAHNGEPGRGYGAEDDGDEPFSRFARLVLRFAARARSNLQHLGRGDAFGIGQVRGRYQRAPERDREHHTEHTAAQADEKRLPERETCPPADDYESGQNEDDRRERPGRGGDGLDDVVLEDRRVLEGAQEGHRNHRRGDRRGEGEADLEAEIDVGRSEDGRDERAEDQAADRKLFWFHAAVSGCQFPNCHFFGASVLLSADINPKRHRSNLLTVSIGSPGDRLPLRFLKSWRHETDPHREVVVRSGNESKHWPGMRVLC